MNIVPKFILTNKIGLIIRTFAGKEELVDGQVSSVIDTVRQALEMEMFSQSVFSRIDVLVSADPRYLDSDCGKTAEALRLALESFASRRIFVSEVTQGDIFCGLLNLGIVNQIRDEVDYSVILSSGVRSYLTNATMGRVCEAAANGAKVVGVAIQELTDSILEGRIANTFAMWHIDSLLTVGGFDLRASKPRKDDKNVLHLQGWSSEKASKDGDGEVYYPLSGVEEIIPLIRLVRTFGPCIAPVLPDEESSKQWVPPTDAEGIARNQKKMGTKFQRQMAFAAMEGAELSFLEGGVMPEFRKQ